MTLEKIVTIVIMITLGVIIGMLIGYNMHGHSTQIEVRTQVITIPSITSSGQSQTTKPLIHWYPFNPDSLELDSLRSVARDYLRVAPPYETYRSDSTLEIYIKSFPLTRVNWDSVIVKARQILHSDTTAINYVTQGTSKWFIVTTIVEAIIIVAKFLL